MIDFLFNVFLSMALIVGIILLLVILANVLGLFK